MNENQSVRLNKHEREYIETYHDSKFSNYVHDAILKDRKLITQNKKQNILSNYTQETVMFGIGVMFLIFSIDQQNLFSFLVLLLLGVFMTVTSLIRIFLKLKEIKVVCTKKTKHTP